MAVTGTNETQALDRIRFVTRHFHNLQGLRHMVPLGLITLGAAAFFTKTPLLFLGAAPFLGGFLLMLGARRYYRRTFGQAEPHLPNRAAEPLCVSIYNSPAPAPWLESSPPSISTVRRPLLILGLAPSLFLLFQFILGPPWIKLQSGVLLWDVWDVVPGSWPAYGSFPTSLVFVLFGSLFLSVWLLREHRLSQIHHLGLGLLLLGFSVLGTAPPWGALLLCGSAMILAGLLDHWQLIRALKR